jgi:TonB family protein
MIFPAILLAMHLALSQTPAPPAGASALSRARSLYESAAYEEALSLLIAIEDPANVGEVEQYRALCLLALGRPADAERALEEIVLRKPLFAMDVKDVSPRLVLMYRDVRLRLVPTVARNLFARGKASFDAKRYPQAATQLQELITLLSIEEPATSGNGLPELKQLADGFLKLALAETEAVHPSAGASGPDQPDTVYSLADRTVIAPVEISRHVPTRVALGKNEGAGLYQGLIEIVIDDAGLVRSARVVRSITPTYDASLLQATRDWRFQPATLNGAPVSYRKQFEIIVHSR